MVPFDPIALADLKKLPRFIYITGCDGTGKSTQSRLLLQQLNERGIKARHLWLRFPFLFCSPLLLYARLRGYSRYERFGNIQHGYWDFQKSWLMSQVFPWLLLLDVSLAAIWYIYLPMWFGRAIVCERFVLDMLVDLSVAFGDTRIFENLLGSLYLRLLPQDSTIIILELDEEKIRQRRSDLKLDRRLGERLNAFRELTNRLNLPVLSSLRPVEEVNETIWGRLVA